MNLIGSLLIAPPALKGNFWYKTVVMITEHHHAGTIGIVLNKRSNLTIEEFGNQIGLPLHIPGYIYQGGPVNPNNLSFLHSSDWSSKNTMRLSEDFCLSSDEEILPRLSLGDYPKYWRLFLGVAGWAPGQLTGELNGTPPWKREHSWCTCQANLDLIFESDNADQWCNAIDKSGKEFAHNILL
jgi:putative transcriptional regulator